MISKSEIDRREGRRLFGLDQASYNSVRPEYPEAVFDLLRDRCGLGPGHRVFEVGAGSGLATRRIATLGASSIVAIEPDERFHSSLNAIASETGCSIEIRAKTFEESNLSSGQFDLGVAATSFHWIASPQGLLKAAAALRLGGWWAMWWNVFGDPARFDPFYEATMPILGPLSSSPSSGESGVPFALDTVKRRAEIESIGLFRQIEDYQWPWDITLKDEQMRALYATFSPIARLEQSERERVLNAITEIARSQFNGRIEKRIITALYLARRRER